MNSKVVFAVLVLACLTATAMGTCDHAYACNLCYLLIVILSIIADGICFFEDHQCFDGQFMPAANFDECCGDFNGIAYLDLDSNNNDCLECPFYG